MNQRIDLVQEQMDILWQIAQLGCEQKYTGLCVSNVAYDNLSHAANLSRNLSAYLVGEWSTEFNAMMDQLRVSVVTTSSTRVDVSLAEGLTSWITQAAIHLKEWAGMASLGGIIILGAVLGVAVIMRLRIRQWNQMAMMIQAFWPWRRDNPLKYGWLP